MRILALEPYFGGSHEAFLRGWQAASEHEWTLVTAPAHGWKWRMRHAAITFAEDVAARWARGERWDAVVCSDMLNLAEFIGLSPPGLHVLPRIAYFHENQLSYPVQHDEPRDVHFGLINMSTARAADAVWFNSAYHRESFLASLREFLEKMRPPQMLECIEKILVKSAIQPPGIDLSTWQRQREPGPMHIVWAARWEHDKGPETFFAALDALAETGADFRVSVIGEQFLQRPDCFDEARRRLGGRVVRWGYQEDRDAYIEALAAADVAVSTAEHEFFGLSMLEAAAAGAWPVLPQRLAYPEIFQVDGETPAAAFYDGTIVHLTAVLAELARDIEAGGDLAGRRRCARTTAERYGWTHRAAAMDRALAERRRAVDR
jgi:glycosyltransferase involved in cell wall biosynthesis